MKQGALKFLYASVFCLLLPALLMAWAHFTERKIQLPIIDVPLAGWILTVSGIWLIVQAMLQLWFQGKGLPMNGFPPQKHVSAGVYKLFVHPIYVGACFLAFGISIVLQSRSGFWLVSPVFTLACIALTSGYENAKIKKLFSLKKLQSTIGFPNASNEKVNASDIASVFVLIFVPWLVLYELKVYTGSSLTLTDVNFPGESSWPVYEWTELFYMLIYPFVVLYPFFAGRKKPLREFMITSAWAIAMGMFIFFIFPFSSEFRPIDEQDVFGKFLKFERAYDSSAAAFPSFHVIWALLAAKGWSLSYAKFRHLFSLIAISVIISCSTTGMHSIADIAAGITVFSIANYRRAIWIAIKMRTEKIANSWKEYRFGKVRVISHAVWPGLACAAGILIAQSFLNNIFIMLIVSSCAVICAGLWGQLIEGSPRLLRPFGYYGAVIGGAAGCLASALLFNVELMSILTAFALASPWVQAIGRVRCWIQGCCHGCITEEKFGIRYVHPKSRVNKISSLAHQPLHNTQLYSIISNCITGIILFRLVYANSSVDLICGLYFILNGLSRFVEEAFRGEAQTKLVMDLRAYQWLAIAGVLTGIFITTLNTETAPITFNFQFDASTLIVSVACGLLSAFAMGIDFPESNVRFSRLAD